MSEQPKGVVNRTINTNIAAIENCWLTSKPVFSIIRMEIHLTSLWKTMYLLLYKLIGKVAIPVLRTSKEQTPSYEMMGKTYSYVFFNWTRHEQLEISKLRFASQFTWFQQITSTCGYYVTDESIINNVHYLDFYGKS